MAIPAVHDALLVPQTPYARFNAYGIIQSWTRRGRERRASIGLPRSMNRVLAYVLDDLGSRA